MNAKQIVSFLGGPAKVAEIVGGITSQAVSQWRRVPARHCVTLAQASLGVYSVHDLRPDIFGVSQDQLPDRREVERRDSERREHERRQSAA